MRPSRARYSLRILPAAALLLAASTLLTPLADAKEYGRYLYTVGDAKDAGGITLTLAEGAPPLVIAVAMARRSLKRYRGKVVGNVVTFEHLPTDIYDVFLVTAERFYEGAGLVRRETEPPTAEVRAAIEAELKQIEGFFDGKRLTRLAVSGERAGALLQQWRIGRAVRGSGARIPGTIHSIDIIFFAQPNKGWQLDKRCQIYRDELKRRDPLVHVHVEQLGRIRVAGKVREVGPVTLEQE
jgi:hypothetical protein